MAVLPCVFGLLFYYAIQYAYGVPYAFWPASAPWPGPICLTAICAALLGVAVALLAFLLSGGLRACGTGMALAMAWLAGWAFYSDWRARNAPNPGGYLYYLISYFTYGNVIMVLTAAIAAYMLVCLVRLLLPVKLLDEAAKANFRSFFRIAGLGLLILLCLVMFCMFVIERERNKSVFLFFPLGFLLRGLFRCKSWVSVAACVGFSVLIADGQWLFAYNHYGITDLLLNTFGGALGVLTVILLGALRRKITRGEEGTSFLAWS